MASRTVEKIPLLSATLGVEKFLTVIRYGDFSANNRGKHVYLQAAIHADEWPGILTLNHLQSKLDALDAAGKINGKITLVPYANPIGMSQFLNGYQLGRFDFDYSGNFNRNYIDLSQVAEQVADKLTDDEAENTAIIRAAFAELIANTQVSLEVEALKKVLFGLSASADYVLDLHCDADAALHIFANKRQQQMAEVLSANVGNEVLILEEDVGGLAFDYANASPWWLIANALKAKGINKPINENACFAATVELRGQRDVYDHLNEQDAKNLLNFLATQGIVDKAVETKTHQPLIAPLSGVDTIKAPSAGLIAFKKQLGERVAKGELVAELIDYTKPVSETKRVPIYSKTEGILFAKLGTKLVRPGHVICQVAGEAPLASRSGKNLLAF